MIILVFFSHCSRSSPSRLKLFPHMRSLTHSSAGLLNPSSSTNPDTHFSSFTPPLPSASHTPPIGFQLPTTTHNLQRTPPPIGHPFFTLNNDTPLLSVRARNHVSQAIQDSLAHSTLKRYSGTIKQFIRFCDAERIPDRLRFPADEFVLCAFAASSLGRHAGSTPRSRISALKAWHITHNIEWKGSARLRYVLNGVHNSAPRSSRRPPRPPINAAMLSQLVENLDLELPFDAVVAACAATAFWGQCRLGELLPLSSYVPSSNPLPIHSDFKKSAKNPQSRLLHLPCTKTHRHGQDVVLVDQRAPINPISLLENHIRVSDVPNDRHIFSFLSTDGLLSLSKPLFLQRCNAIWSSLGYPRTTGHCFRIGGTTELLVAGTHPDVVRATGRWSSESFLRYWRSLDAIAPRHIRNLHIPRHRHERY
jgi:hypothetical protein